MVRLTSHTHIIVLSSRFYFSVFSKCEHAITFFAQEIQIENIGLRVIRKILYKKFYVLNLSKIILGSTIILLDYKDSSTQLLQGYTVGSFACYGINLFALKFEAGYR